MSDERLIYRTLPASETTICFLSDHTFGKTQKKTIKKMHGNCKTEYHGGRYGSYDEWKKKVLRLTQRRDVTGIYIVIKTEWRKRFVEEYAMKGKINGALIGWFIGFGSKDDLKGTTQSMTYIWRGCMLKFKVEETFGRAPIVRARFLEEETTAKERPQKTEQRRKY